MANENASSAKQGQPSMQARPTTLSKDGLLMRPGSSGTSSPFTFGNPHLGPTHFSSGFVKPPLRLQHPVTSSIDPSAPAFDQKVAVQDVVSPVEEQEYESGARVPALSTLDTSGGLRDPTGDEHAKLDAMPASENLIDNQTAVAEDERHQEGQQDSETPAYAIDQQQQRAASEPRSVHTSQSIVDQLQMQGVNEKRRARSSSPVTRSLPSNTECPGSRLPPEDDGDPDPNTVNGSDPGYTVALTVTHGDNTTSSPRSMEGGPTGTGRAGHSLSAHTNYFGPRFGTLTYHQLLGALESKRKDDNAATVRRYEDMVHRFRQELTELNDAYQRSEDLVRALSHRVEGLEQEKIQIDRQLGETKDVSARIGHTNKQLTAKEAASQQERRHLNATNATLSAELEQAKLKAEDFQERLKGLQEDFVKTDAEISQLKTSNASLKTEKKILAARNGELWDQLSESRSTATEERNNRLIASQQTSAALSKFDGLIKKLDEFGILNAHQLGRLTGALCDAKKETLEAFSKAVNGCTEQARHAFLSIEALQIETKSLVKETAIDSRTTRDQVSTIHAASHSGLTQLRHIDDIIQDVQKALQTNSQLTEIVKSLEQRRTNSEQRADALSEELKQTVVQLKQQTIRGDDLSKDLTVWRGTVRHLLQIPDDTSVSVSTLIEHLAAYKLLRKEIDFAKASLDRFSQLNEQIEALSQNVSHGHDLTVQSLLDKHKDELAKAQEESQGLRLENTANSDKCLKAEKKCMEAEIKIKQLTLEQDHISSAVAKLKEEKEQAHVQIAQLQAKLIASHQKTTSKQMRDFDPVDTPQETIAASTLLQENEPSAAPEGLATPDAEHVSKGSGSLSLPDKRYDNTLVNGGVKGSGSSSESFEMASLNGTNTAGEKASVATSVTSVQASTSKASKKASAKTNPKRRVPVDSDDDYDVPKKKQSKSTPAQGTRARSRKKKTG